MNLTVILLLVAVAAIAYLLLKPAPAAAKTNTNTGQNTGTQPYPAPQAPYGFPYGIGYGMPGNSASSGVQGAMTDTQAGLAFGASAIRTVGDVFSSAFKSGVFGGSSSGSEGDGVFNLW